MTEIHRCKTWRAKKYSLVGQPQGTYRCRWENNIKNDLHEFGFGGLDWFDLAQDRERWRAFVIAVMKRRDSIK